MKKIKADYDACEANAVCVSIDPEVFHVDDNDFLHLRSEEVTADNEARMIEAVNRCPKAALSIVEE
ncbi:MAG: ferredoxin [Nitriliruptorales bacterium]|nr:ferredoxin [Nitriliruptorales bacterium]